MMGRPSSVNLAVEAAYSERLRLDSDINQLLPVLRAYAEQCDHITEFGVRKGNSTIAFLSARPKVLRSYDIEPFQLVKQFDGFGKTCGAGEFVFQQGDTRKIEIDPTDLLFIDTLHTFDQLAAELVRHSDKARKWIMIHDTETFGEVGEDGNPGINKAIDQWSHAIFGLSWRLHSHIPFNNGLSIFKRCE